MSRRRTAPPSDTPPVAWPMAPCRKCRATEGLITSVPYVQAGRRRFHLRLSCAACGTYQCFLPKTMLEEIA